MNYITPEQWTTQSHSKILEWEQAEAGEWDRAEILQDDERPQRVRFKAPHRKEKPLPCARLRSNVTLMMKCYKKKEKHLYFRRPLCTPTLGLHQQKHGDCHLLHVAVLSAERLRWRDSVGPSASLYSSLLHIAFSRPRGHPLDTLAFLLRCVHSPLLHVDISLGRENEPGDLISLSTLMVIVSRESDGGWRREARRSRTRARAKKNKDGKTFRNNMCR